MLACELTPNNIGITVWGDYYALSQLHQLIHYIDNSSVDIDDKDAFLGHMPMIYVKQWSIVVKKEKLALWTVVLIYNMALIY